MAISETSQGGLSASSYAEEQESAVVDGVRAKKVFPIILNPLAQTNASITLTQTDNVVASTQTLTKTIGATTYTKTISKNAAGQTLSVSVWS